MPMLILVIRYMIQREDINDLRKDLFFSNTNPGKLMMFCLKINHEEGGKRVV